MFDACLTAVDKVLRGANLMGKKNAATDIVPDRPRKTLGWRTPAEVLNDYLAAA